MYTHRSLATGSNFEACSFLYPLGFGYLDHGEALCRVLSSQGSWALGRVWAAFPLCLLQMPARSTSHAAPNLKRGQADKGSNRKGEKLR